MKRLLILFFSAFILAGCSKMEEKKTSNTQEQQNTKKTPTDIKDPHSNMSSTTGLDSAALKMSQIAYDFEKVYEKNKTDGNKQELIKKHLAAGNAFSPDGNMQHMSRESIRTSLKHYKRVLELDPENAEAKKGRETIEAMYQQIGLPVPD